MSRDEVIQSLTNASEGERRKLMFELATRGWPSRREKGEQVTAAEMEEAVKATIRELYEEMQLQVAIERDRAIEEGKTQAIPAAEAMAMIRKANRA